MVHVKLTDGSCRQCDGELQVTDAADAADATMQGLLRAEKGRKRGHSTFCRGRAGGMRPRGAPQEEVGADQPAKTAQRGVDGDAFAPSARRSRSDGIESGQKSPLVFRRPALDNGPTSPAARRLTAPVL